MSCAHVFVCSILVAMSEKKVSAKTEFRCVLMAERYSIVHVYHVFFIQSSVNEHVDWLYIFIIVECATVNMGLQITHMLISFHLGKLSLEWLGHMTGSFPVSGESPYCRLHDSLGYRSHPQWVRTPFLAHSPAFIIFLFLEDMHFNWNEVNFHCGFYLQFPGG